MKSVLKPKPVRAFFNVGDLIFFVYCNELDSGKITAVIRENDGKEDKISYKVETTYVIHTVEQDQMSASVESLFKRLFERYKVEYNKNQDKQKNRAKPRSSLKWEGVFTAENTAL